MNIFHKNRSIVTMHPGKKRMDFLIYEIYGQKKM